MRPTQATSIEAAFGASSMARLDKSQRFWVLIYLSRAQGQLGKDLDDTSEAVYRKMCQLINADTNPGRRKIDWVPTNEFVTRLWRRVTRIRIAKARKERRKGRGGKKRSYRREIRRLAIMVRTLAMRRLERIRQVAAQTSDQENHESEAERREPAPAA